MAPKITHICISDMHAGALTSFLTPIGDDMKWTGDPDQVTATTQTFGAAMAATMKSLGTTGTELILLGDGLDLSLSPPERSFPVLKGFLKALYGDGAAWSSKMPYIPGNHDHWLWSAEQFSGPDFSAPGHTHISDMYPDDDGSHMSAKLNTYLSDLNIEVPLYYPNYALWPGRDPASPDATGRQILFHHGHFIEPTYRVMSGLLSALSGKSGFDDTSNDLEMYNGAWIDFGWSTLGNAGLLGDDVAAAYQILLTGGASEALEHRIAGLLRDTLLKRLNLPNTATTKSAADLLTRGLVDVIVGSFSQLERFDYNTVLSAGAIEGLRSYVSGPMITQIKNELHDLQPDALKDTPTTFIFGHTHKPFEDLLPIEGFAQPVAIYNTGGWILDTSLLSTVEGASLVFIDEGGNTASLRLFAPPVNGMVAGVEVIAADPVGAADLVAALNAAIGSASTQWADFSKAAAQDYELRQKVILSIAERAQHQANQTGGLV